MSLTRRNVLGAATTLPLHRAPAQLPSTSPEPGSFASLAFIRRLRIRYSLPTKAGLATATGRSTSIRMSGPHLNVWPPLAGRHRAAAGRLGSHACQSAREWDPLSASKRDPLRFALYEAIGVSLFG
jgi:hypothetical protein